MGDGRFRGEACRCAEPRRRSGQCAWEPRPGRPGGEPGHGAPGEGRGTRAPPVEPPPAEARPFCLPGRRAAQGAASGGAPARGLFGRAAGGRGDAGPGPGEAPAAPEPPARYGPDRGWRGEGASSPPAGAGGASPAGAPAAPEAPPAAPGPDLDELVAQAVEDADGWTDAAAYAVARAQVWEPTREVLDVMVAVQEGTGLPWWGVVGAAAVAARALSAPLQGVTRAHGAAREREERRAAAAAAGALGAAAAAGPEGRAYAASRVNAALARQGHHNLQTGLAALLNAYLTVAPVSATLALAGARPPSFEAGGWAGPWANLAAADPTGVAPGVAMLSMGAVLELALADARRRARDAGAPSALSDRRVQAACRLAAAGGYFLVKDLPLAALEALALTSLAQCALSAAAHRRERVERAGAGAEEAAAAAAAGLPTHAPRAAGGGAAAGSAAGGASLEEQLKAARAAEEERAGALRRHQRRGSSARQRSFR